MLGHKGIESDEVVYAIRDGASGYVNELTYLYVPTRRFQKK